MPPKVEQPGKGDDLKFGLFGLHRKNTFLGQPLLSLRNWPTLGEVVSL